MAAGLRSLIREFVARRMEVKPFCDAFEQVFNLELDKAGVSAEELSILSALFDTVVWYSPYPDERAQVRNYLDEASIRSAAETAAAQLGLSARD